MTQRLRLFSIAALGINTIVGSGIFSLPSELIAAMGSASWLAFVAAAGILAVVAIAFAVCGRLVTGDGGAYRYSREAFGPVIGAVIGVSVFVATVTTFSAVCAAIPGQAAEFVPAIGDHPKLYATLIVIALGGINAIGVRAGAWVSDVLVVVKLVPLIAFAVIGIWLIEPSRVAHVSSHGLGAALLPAFFALSGFETCAIPAGSAARPTRDVPLAVLGSLGGATVLYVLIQLVVVGLGGGATDRPLVDASRAFLGDAGAAAMAVLAVISMLGLAAAMALAGARLCSVVTSDRTGVGLTAGLAAVGTLAVDFDALVDFTSYLLIAQYIAVCIAAVVLAYRRR